MPHRHLNDLLAFVAVACERSFTRAAAQLGVSPSALSRTVRLRTDKTSSRSASTRACAPESR